MSHMYLSYILGYILNNLICNACMRGRSDVSNALRLWTVSHMGCSLPGSSVHGFLQARILKWVAISSSWGSSWPRDQTRVSCIGMQVLYLLATWEALYIINNAKQNCFVYYSDSFQYWSWGILSVASCASLTYFPNGEFFWGLSSFLEFQDDLGIFCVSCPVSKSVISLIIPGCFMGEGD